MNPTVGVATLCGSSRKERLRSHLDTLEEADAVLVVDWDSDRGLPPLAEIWNRTARRLRDSEVLVFTNQDLHYPPSFLPEVRSLCRPGVRLCGWWQDISEEDYHAGRREARDPGEVDSWSLVIWGRDFFDLGAFDERLPFFGTDVNMNERLKAAGFRREVLSEPFWHLSHERDPALLPLRNRCLAQARELTPPGECVTKGNTGQPTP